MTAPLRQRLVDDAVVILVGTTSNKWLDAQYRKTARELVESFMSILASDEGAVEVMAAKLLDLDYPRDWPKIYRPDSAQHRAVQKMRAALAALARHVGEG